MSIDTSKPVAAKPATDKKGAEKVQASKAPVTGDKGNPHYAAEINKAKPGTFIMLNNYTLIGNKAKR